MGILAARLKCQISYTKFTAHKPPPRMHRISLGDGGEHANFLGFRGSVPLLPHLCQLSVREVGVCRVFSESP